ncbi:MAG: tRNA 2-thiocytidine biosynthesis TtcA family protein [Christensenella sp.]|uniref:tRNA 2-thiocytidine biosynthesis TtcA family protein n=1 Tax=Christensenella sp. TaxID=1935934 RepID=UPI002B21DC4C|nr:tRNA 2-thiocytidine biosynthesis TtcA family protein [Christensenella sp.]MEA5002543.1 tRNA 2-thiocytidine biosynthesis TtcA family protein [Christensenella sp.]
MRKILGGVRRADEQFTMIRPGDKVAVGLSGGKDSMLLLYALKLYQKYAKKDYELCAITIDLGFGNYATDVMQRYADELDIPLTIVKTNISEIVFDIRKEKNPCSLCAKMRKGAFYENAQNLHCNKAAFAHHGDDVIQTLLMSLMYEGRMNTFSPKSYMSRRGITLLRPFVFLRESDIISAVRRHDIPIAKNPCPIDFSTKREQAKDIVNYLNSLYPGTADNMLNAIKSTHTYNLWDKDFSEH